MSEECRDFPFEVVIVQRDGTFDVRALTYASSDAVALAEIRPGYYGTRWVARRRSDHREVVATEHSSLEALRDGMREDAHRIVMDALRPTLREAGLKPAEIGQVGRAVREALERPQRRDPNWMGLGHGTRLLDILDGSPPEDE